MKIKFIAVIALSKILTKTLKLLGKGSGTALPGLFAEKYAPDILKYLADQIPNTILITGTNGKTTTQTILASILEENNQTVLRNKSGSNLKRGLISTLMRAANLKGRINYDYLLFEIEEATIPKVVEDLQPKYIIVTNLYRDQLDAYGEIDRTQKFIQEAFRLVPATEAILNADDPRVSSIVDDMNIKTHYYGLEETFHKHFRYEGDKDHSIHLPTEQAINIDIQKDLSAEFSFMKERFHVQTPGIFHVYNSIAAILTANILGIKKSAIKKGAQSAKPAFGRGEIFEKDGINYQVLLVKNPAGLDLTLDLLTNVSNPNIALMLNDNIADGKDVSWIWDATFEKLQLMRPNLLICSGERAEDMLVRVKYAFEGLEKVETNVFKNIKYGTSVIFNKEIETVHEKFVEKLEKGSHVYILPTYTAMLTLRKTLLGNALNQ